jgi:hypothetical protein
MITLQQYWMGRDLEYAADLTAEIEANAQTLLERVNLLLEKAAADGVIPDLDATTGTQVGSGWRPKTLNDTIPNAGKTSNHIIGLAVDLRDLPPERALARWCLRNGALMEEVGLWMEDPKWTPSWVHLQSRPPKSGKRVYVPSDSPALAAALPEQQVA